MKFRGQQTIISTHRLVWTRCYCNNTIRVKSKVFKLDEHC